MTREAARTIEFCRGLGKPRLVIDAVTTSIEEAARQAREFVQGRECVSSKSSDPQPAGREGYDYAYRTIQKVIFLFLQR